MDDVHGRREGDEADRAALELEAWIDPLLRALGLVWLALLVVELTRGLPAPLEALSVAIWIAFLLDFVVRFALAADKHRYLRRNWFAGLSIALPALRFVRALRVLRYARLGAVTSSARLVRIVSATNRAMNGLRRTFARRRFGYVVVATGIVAVAGAAGMSAFEGAVDHPDAPRTFFAALWWTAMLLTTIGSAYWPQTGGGQVLCFLLSLYGLAVFGYITATLATYFVGRDAADPGGELPSAAKLEELRKEVASLRAAIALAAARPDGESG